MSAKEERHAQFVDLTPITVSTDGLDPSIQVLSKNDYIFNMVRVRLGCWRKEILKEGFTSPSASLFCLIASSLTVAGPDSFPQGLPDSTLAPLAEPFTLACVSLAVF